MQGPHAARYDPNHLLDELLRRLNLEGDDALADTLNVGRHFLYRIRRGEVAPGAPLLIRINERCGISVRELRRMLGDRRSQYRLEEPAPDLPERPERALPSQQSRVRNDAGLPNTVQWT